MSPTSGPIAGGTSVTISGTNLSGATAVTFGGTAGTITANTATSITVTTQARAAGGLVDVAVTTPGGTVTKSAAFTYFDVGGAPELTSATPGDLSASIAFTPGSPLGTPAPTNYQYSLNGGVWTALSIPKTTSPVTIPNLTAGTTYSVQLRAISVVSGSTVWSSAASNALSVTPFEKAGPPTALSATAGDGEAQIAFTAGSPAGSPALTNYEYELNGSGTWVALSPVDDASPVTITGLTNGTSYSVKLRAVSVASGTTTWTGTPSAAVTVVPFKAGAAPTLTAATAGDKSAEVEFTAGSPLGSPAPTNYQYSTDGGTTWTALAPADATSPVTIPGLTAGTTYSVQLRAISVVSGSTVWSSAASNALSVTPFEKAGPPTALSATAGDGQAEIAFTAGSPAGSPALTNYEYELDGSGTWVALSPVDDASPVTIPGLTNGTSYSVKLRAVSVASGTTTWAGAASAAVTVMPFQAGAAPTALTATPGDKSVSIAFTPGSPLGTPATTNYEYSLDGGSWTALNPADTTSPITITGLTNDTTYAITLRAVSGSTWNSAASSPVSVRPFALPGAPTLTNATGGDGQAEITFTAGSAGTEVTTNYEYSLDGGSWTALNPANDTSPATITSLTNGTTYSVRLRAVTTDGEGPASNALTVMPFQIGAAPTAVVATAKDGSASIAFTPGSPLGTPAPTNYEYQLDGGSWVALSPVDTASPITITGLTNGQEYKVKVRAVSGSTWDGAASTEVSVTPFLEAGAPTITGIATDYGQATVAFTPGLDGTSPTTNIQYSTDGGTTWTTRSPISITSPLVISGLANGTTYSVLLRGVSSYGPGAASSPVSAVIPSPPAPNADPAPAPTATATPTPDPAPVVDPLDPIGQVQNPNIPAAGVPAGRSVLLVGGQPVPVTVAPNARTDATGLVVSGDGWSMRLQGRGGANDPLGLTSQQALVLESEPVQRARSVVLARGKAQPFALSAGTGFKPNSVVKFYILPGTYLGELPTDASGSYEGRVPIPAGIPAGVHTLQVNGYAPGDVVRSLSLGVLVKEATRTVRTTRTSSSVLFARSSSVLTDAGKATLRTLVKRTGRDVVRVVSVGYVQRSGTNANDQSLSTARAKAVGSYLRSLGVRGTYTVRGDGVGGPKPKDRKVVVTVTYRK